MFQNLATTARDGVILENLNPPLFTRPAAEIVARKTPVIALDTAPTAGSNINFYVGNDNYDLGVSMATELLKRLPASPTGSVVVGVPNPGTPVLDNRAKGIKDTLNQRAPKIRVLGPYQTYSEPTQNYNAWSAQVHAHPDALAFLGVGDADSYDLARLKQEQHGTWLTAGFDVDAKTLQAVKDGTNFITVDPEHYLKGYLSAALLIDAVRSKAKTPPHGWFVSPGGVVDSGNVDQVIAREASQQAFAWYKSTIDQLRSAVSANIKPLDQAR
jgi:ribose transport system substrate-binding protein